jgi:predicted enzyme related to lactoylglutathione lyase
VDSGLVASRDGTPRTVPVIRVDSIDAVRPRLEAAGATVVVEPFAVPGVGRGGYAVDPAGLLIGLHEYDSQAE